MIKKLNFTQKQIEDAMMNAFEIENPSEKKIELLKLRCRIRQKEYYSVGDLESVVNEELNLMDETIMLEEPNKQTSTIIKPKVRMKVASSFCMAIFKKAGISLANFDASRIADAISLMTGFSTDSIRKYIREQTGFLPADNEARTAQSILETLGVHEKLLA